MRLDWIVSCEQSRLLAMWGLCGRWRGWIYKYHPGSQHSAPFYLSYTHWETSVRSHWLIIKILLQNVFQSSGSWRFYFECNLIPNSSEPTGRRLTGNIHAKSVRVERQNQATDLVCDFFLHLLRCGDLVQSYWRLALTALFKVANNDNNRIVMLVLIITSSACTLNN